jgi:hypothetical protein
MISDFQSLILIFIIFFAPNAGAKTFAEMFPHAADLKAGEVRDFLESLDYRQGKIELYGGFATSRFPRVTTFLARRMPKRCCPRVGATRLTRSSRLG